MKVEVTFLGTGTSSGVPMLGCSCEVCTSKNPKDCRLRSSVMVTVGQTKIVIDCGMDFRQQMLREKIESIDGILLTHPHMDHIGGLDDLRAYNYFSGKSTDIYCNNTTLKVIKKVFYYAFAKDLYPGALTMNIHKICNTPFQIHGIEVIPIEGLHYNLQVFGYRIGDFVYITDMNQITDKELAKAQGCKVLVINALREEPHLSHFTLSEAIAISKKIAPKATYLTHISHQMMSYSKLEKFLPDTVYCAYDGLKFIVE